MPEDNYSRVTLGLRALHASLVPFVERELKAHLKERWWSEGVLRILSEQQVMDVNRDVPAGKKPTTEHLDIALLLHVLDANWGEVFRLKLSRDARTWLKELQGTRNRWAHAKKGDPSSDDAWRALDTVARVLEVLPDHKTMQEVRKLCAEVRDAEVKAMMAKTPAAETKTGVQTLPGASPLLPWRDIATPHPDVAKGKYRQAEFAADLAQVLAGSATPEYQAPPSSSNGRISPRG